jgi:hypothetical protein
MFFIMMNHPLYIVNSTNKSGLRPSDVSSVVALLQTNRHYVAQHAIRIRNAVFEGHSSDLFVEMH